MLDCLPGVLLSQAEMIRFLTDEDFNGRIIRGLFLRNTNLDLVRIQDVGLQGADDPIILEQAEEWSSRC